MDLSIIIVNYNVKYFLEQCLYSVRKAISGMQAEVFVVDNHSVDGSCAMVREIFPEVFLIENQQNVGFSKANNQAILLSKGKYVLLLNPDTVVGENTFEKCFAFMDNNPIAGALGVKMIDGKGNFLAESKRALPTPIVAFYKIFGLSRLFPKSKKFSRYHLGFLDKEKVHEIEILPGAFMFMRKEALNKVGLLDEDFFMYGEDIDLSYRFILAGYKNYYYPETTIIHYKGESTKKGSINYVLVFYNAMIIFAKKHFTGRNAEFYILLINLAIYLRALMAMMRRVAENALLPFLDTLLFLLGNLFIANKYASIKFSGTQKYPTEYFQFIIPAYIIIWLVSIYLAGGYKRPVKIQKTIRGILGGTFFILIVYALLPEGMRFSRALLIIGAVWALIAAHLNRILLHVAGFKKYQFATSRRKRIAIVGDVEEATRVSEILNSVENKIELIGFLSIGKKVEGRNYLGNIEQVQEIIHINKLDELIFCAGDISSTDIMTYMLTLSNLSVDYKIAPPKSLSIIGSNSINTAGELYTIQLNSIAKEINKRKKRLFDVASALTLLLLPPIILMFVENYAGFYKNLYNVLSGRKSWVGFIRTNMNLESVLPTLKEGVLNPSDVLDNKDITVNTAEKMNIIYAKDYKVETDFTIMYKGFKKLGRQPDLN